MLPADAARMKPTTQPNDTKTHMRAHAGERGQLATHGAN